MLSACIGDDGVLPLALMCLLLQESKAASELADKALGDVQRSSNDMAQLNSWLQVGAVHHTQTCLQTTPVLPS
jgi:hypothetical protein